MADFKLQLLIQANARAASAEVKGVAAEVKALTSETAKAGSSQASAAADAKALQAAMAALKAEIDQVTRAEQQAAAAHREMVALGGAETAQARELQVALAQLGATKAGLVTEHNVATAAIAAEQRAFDGLRASLDPVFAQKQRMIALETQLAQAVRLGAASQDEAADVMRMAKAEMAGLDGAMGRVGDGARRAAGSFDFRGPLQQLSQVSQMAMATGNVTQSLAIQLPDIGMAFGPIGIALGVIAGIALPAAANLLGFGNAGETAADQVEAAAAAVDAYSAAVDRASSPDADLFGQFGAAVGPARELLEVRRELMLLDAEQDLRASSTGIQEQAGLNLGLTADGLRQQLQFYEETSARIRQLREEMAAAEASGDGEGFFRLNFELAQQLGAIDGYYTQLDASISDLGTRLNLGTIEAQNFAQALVAIDDAPGPREQAEALRAAIDALVSGAGGYGVLNDEAKAFVDLLEQTANAALRTAAAQDRGVETVQAKIDSLRQEAVLQEVIATYGRDSVEVAALQRDEARAAMEAWADTQGVTAELKAELMAAWDAANGVAGASGRINFSAAVSGAAAIAQNLGVALSVAQALAGTAYGAANATADDGRGSQREVVQSGIQANTDRILSEQAQLPWRQALQRGLRPGGGGSGGGGSGGGSGGGGGGSGASTVDREREAIRDLIASLEDEIALARESDPVRQELLRHREDLAGATAEERAQVEQLIRTRDAEAEALDRLQDMQDEARDQTKSFIRDLIDAARQQEGVWGAVANMLDNVADKLADLASENISSWLWGGQGQSGGGLLGGLLGGLFGLGGGGGLPGSTASILGVTPHAAGGVPGLSEFSGQVVGRPTLFGLMGEAGDEAILPLSGGGVRAMMGGRETRLPLVRLPGGQLGVDVQPYAMGGVPGGARVASSSGGGMFGGGGAEGTTRVVIEASEEFRASIVETARRVAVETVTRGLQAYDRRLPERLRGIDADPGYVG